MEFPTEISVESSMDEIPDLSSDEDVMPDGDMYPLNSKRVKAAWIRRIAETLELPTTASLEETRQMIEGKLTGLRYQPENVQVVVQGKDEGAVIFLVNETGIIFVYLLMTVLSIDQ